MRSLLIGLAFAGAAHAAEPFPPETNGGALASHPALYSFADVYRLTVKGPAAGLLTLDGAPDAIRVALRPQAVGPRFSVSRGPERETWLLILAGVAFAGWVAHRRLALTL
jgi:hypothetical protein